jgi:hypothetical protein
LIIEAIGLMALGLGVIGCTSSLTTVRTPSSPSIGAPSARAVVGHVGDGLVVSDQIGNGLIATVLGVVNPAPLDPSPSPNPAALDPGQQPAVVQISIENPSRVTAVRTNVFADMNVIDGHDQSYDPWLPIHTTAGAAFPSAATLAAGEKLVGYVGFRVPVGTAITRVKYAPSSDFAKKEGEWILP